VPYTIAGGTATGGACGTAGVDYANASGSITIAPGATTGTITVPVCVDSLYESNETFTVSLGTPTNATLGATTTATGNIIDDDTAPTVVIATPGAINEGNSGTTNLAFTVTQSAVSGTATTVPYSVAGGTATGGACATAGVDYVNTSSSVAILAGSTTATFNIAFCGDTTYEANETFIVTLGTPTNATLGATTTATGTITNDDAPPTVVIATPGAIPEGNSNLSFTVTQSATSGLATTVPYTIASGTATGGAACGPAGVDYVNAGGSITIAAGATTGTIAVPVCGDTLYEANETFTVTLGTPTNATLGGSTTATGTITDNDTAPTVSIATPSAITEGNSGSTNLTFTVTQSAVTGRDTTVSYTIAGGTATGGAACGTAGVDYVNTGGSITITAGNTTGTITVPICGDATFEATETFTVTLSSPSGATLGTSSATGTITNDDLPAATAIFTLDDQTWDDSSGNNYNGSVGGFGGTAPTFTSTTPAVGNSTTGTCGYRTFSRSDKTYIQVASGFPNLGASGGAFTITGWIRTTDNTQSGQRILIDDENNSSGYGFSLGDGGAGMVRFFTRGASSALILDTPNVVANNTWYFVAAVADVPNKRKYIYVFNTSGTLLSGVSATWTESSFGSDSGVASMGGETNASGENTGSFGFAGNLDEIRVYSGALSQADLGMVRSITRTCPPAVVTPGTFNACEVASPKCVPTALPNVTYAAIVDKNVGQAFTLDGVALLSGGTLNGSFNKTVQVDLVANTNAGVTLNSNNCPTSQTATIALGNKTFASGRATINSSTSGNISIGTAYADVRVKYTCTAANCGTDVTTCSTDNFAVIQANPEHVEFVHNGSALTCAPKAITVYGCTTSAECNGTPANQYTAGTFSVSPTAISGAQWCSDSLCASTLTSPVALSNGQTIYFREPTARTDTLAATTVSTNTTVQCKNTVANLFNSSAACNLSYSSSGLLVSLPNHTSCTGGTQLSVTAVRSSDNGLVCVPAFASVTRPVSVGFSYNNPATGSHFPLVGGTAIATSGTVVDLVFDSTGKATPSFSYDDVGTLSVTATYTGNASRNDAGLSMTGASSTPTVIAPSSLLVTPSIISPDTHYFAGKPFNVSVTGLNACAMPSATPNFGKEGAELTLTCSKATPAAGIAGVFAGCTLTSANNGSFTGTPSWNEVGTVGLSAALVGSGSYLGYTPATAITGAATTGSVGPHHFDTTLTPVSGCSNFIYAGTMPSTAGQTFTVNATAKAYNATAASAATTTNYANILGTVALPVTISAASPTTTVGTLTATSIPVTAFLAGGGSTSTDFRFATKITNPTDVVLHADDTNTAGNVPYQDSSVTTPTHRFRSGRLRLANAFGAEQLALTVPTLTEYWDGTRWLQNTADSCTSFNVPASGSGLALALAAGGTSSASMANGTASGSCTTGTCSGKGTFYLGDGRLTLSAPGAGKTGYVDITLTPPGWLLYSGMNQNTTARASFGLYNQTGNAKKIIYRREVR
jgi:hypothetical protein